MTDVQTESKKSTKNKNGESNGEAKPSNAKALLSAFKAAHAAEMDAKAKVDAAVAKRSDAVQAIKEALGTGPFQIEGLGLVTIRHRPEKNEAGEPTGKATYFFVSMGAKQVTVIE